MGAVLSSAERSARLEALYFSDGLQRKLGAAALISTEDFFVMREGGLVRVGDKMPSPTSVSILSSFHSAGGLAN